MGFSRIGDIAESGLLAQRLRMVVTASNLANVQTTRTAEGGPYQRRDPVFEAEALGGFDGALRGAIEGVRVPRVERDESPGPVRHQPGHPDADENGNVRLPNVDLVAELANLMSAGRSFEANLLVMRKAGEMRDAALKIGR